MRFLTKIFDFLLNYYLIILPVCGVILMVLVFFSGKYYILWLAVAAVVVLTPMADVALAPEDSAGRNKAVAKFFLRRILLLASALVVGLIILAMMHSGLFGG